MISILLIFIGGYVHKDAPEPALSSEAYVSQVRRCWRVDPGSKAAKVTMAIGFDLRPDDTVDADPLRMTSAEGGSEEARREA